MPFDGEAVGEGHPPTRGVSGIAPIAGFHQHGMEHAEFRDFAADTVDFHPVAETNAVAAHQHQPTEERYDEVLQRDGEARAHNADHGAELSRHADDDQQNDYHGDNSQGDASDAAQSLDLPPIQLRIVEQMPQPSVEEQHCDQHDDHDQRIEQQRMRQRV